MVKGPPWPFRVAEKFTLFPLTLPLTSAFPRSPPIVPVNAVPSCVSVSVCDIVPFCVSKETDQVPATVAGFASAGGVCGESCPHAAPEHAKSKKAIKIQNECRFISKSPQPRTTQCAARRLQPPNAQYLENPEKRK